MSDKPYRVNYSLAYDGGGSTWQKDYRTLWGAHIARQWNLRVASWGGSAVLSHRDDRLAARAVAEDEAWRADPDGYLARLETPHIEVSRNHQGAWQWAEIPARTDARYSGSLWWTRASAVADAGRAADKLGVAVVIVNA